MPTVLRVAGFRIMIFGHDHRPAHVHVFGQGGEAVFDLNCPKGPPVVREVNGLSRNDVMRIRKILAAKLSSLCESWESIHGEA